MKKIYRIIALLAAVCLTAALAACGEKTVKPESAEFELETITLAHDEKADFLFTAKPANATVSVKFTDETVAEYVKSEHKIHALTAGSCIAQLVAPDGTVLDECSVTVNPPDGYTIYKTGKFKFAYPSSWSRTSIIGSDVAFQSATGSNLGLSVESPAEDDFFKLTALSYEAMMESASGFDITDCEYVVDKFLGKKRAHAKFTMSLFNSSVHEEQIIMVDEDSTYVLTLAVPIVNGSYDQTVCDVMVSQFALLN